MKSSFKFSPLSLPIISLLLLQLSCGFMDIFPDNAETPENPSLPPTLTLTLPLLTKTSQPSLQPTSPAIPPQQDPLPIKIFLVALEDNGVSGKKIGCNDSVVAVEVPVEIPPSDPPRGAMRASLAALLSINSQYYGESGLYHSLYQSDLKVDEVILENGDAVIRLKGNLQIGGVCDNPRIQAQLEETVHQFPVVKSVRITINNIPLEKLLSGKN